jgi:predicted lactoylglutathione lyase
MSVISTFAFAAAGRAAVEAFDDAAVAYGAEVLHAPKYHAGYGAFVRDPDGSNIEDVPR